MSGAPDRAGFMDKTASGTHAFIVRNCLIAKRWLSQDPYIKITLHDGDFDAGGRHRGESFKTTTKDNAGGNATWNEKFVLNKPGMASLLRP